MAGDEEEEGSPIGKPLRGEAPGQEARRRWYFAHQGFSRLKGEHERSAEGHRKAAEWAESHRENVRSRNDARSERYHAEVFEYEQRRLEKEEARLQWAELRREIRNGPGGVKAASVTEDYRDLPASVRTRSGGESIEDAAKYFGMDSDEFVRYTRSTAERARRAEAIKLERPRRPELEKEPRRRLTAQESAERRVRRQEMRELRDMIRAGEKELGPGHPALQDLRDTLTELKEEEKAA